MALSQEDINDINALIASYINDNKTKVSTLPEAQSLTGLWILGVSAGASVKASMALLAGLDGKNPELRNTGTELQWRLEGGTWAKLVDIADIRGFKQMLQKTSTEIQSKYENEQQWQTLLTLSELKGEKGDNGKEVQLQKTSTHVQWRIEDGTWANLITLEELKGSKGDNGKEVQLQKTSTHVQWRIEDGTWANLVALSELKGEKGDAFTYSDFTPTQLAALKGNPGDEVSLQTTSTHIQWRLGTGSWANLVALADLKGVKGDTGAAIELQKTSTHVQWRVIGTSTWNNLITLEELKVKGDTGASVELQKTATYIQWRVVGSPTWTNLIALSELKVKGDPGENIELQKTSTHVQWRVVGGSWANLVALADLKGDPGQGLPAGGSTGQQLVKKSGTDYDYDWQTPAGAGDMLKSVYDPSGKNGDAFSQDNMKDGTTNKNFTVTDRNNISGKYEKPVTGIPKADLAEAVQTSLGKADSALQSFTETDPTVPNWAKQTNKPAYTATEVGAIPASQKGANNGVAELDSSGKVLSSQLPSYVDDVLEYATSTNFPTTGETGKIYIAINTNLTYRWTGTAYTEISPSIALGETSATAYRGDRGKTAYDHSQTAHAPSNAQKNSDITKAEIEAKLTGAITTHSHTVTKANVGLGNVDNTSDANKPVSTATQTALNGKLDANKMQVVTELPASPVSGTFYFVKE